MTSRIATLVAAGVCLLTGAARSQPAPVALTHLQSIGCEECTGAVHLSNVAAVAVNASGEMLVADREAPMLRIFSRDGTVLGAYGRRGRGPGEYVFPLAVAFGPDRSLHVLDLAVRRLTHLGADGTVKSQVPITVFPGAVSPVGATGEMMVLSDDFHGTLALLRFPSDTTAPALVARVEHPPGGDGTITIPGIAASVSGEVALARDNSQYRISRRTPAGAWLPDLVRDIPRPVRTAEEQAALEKQINGVRGAMAAMEKGRSQKSAPVLTDRTDHSRKPHFRFSGLRYDAQGRLWVQTERGTASQTIFDLFGADGSYLGALTLPQHITDYALGGSYLVTAGERDDGTPVVDLWEVHAAR